MTAISERELPPGTGAAAKPSLERSSYGDQIFKALLTLGAFSVPVLLCFLVLELWQGAATLGLPLDEYLAALRDAGLGSLPGTAAEILDDEVRRVICPDKVTTDQ